MKLGQNTILNIAFLLFAALQLQNYFFPVPAMGCVLAALLIAIVLWTVPSLGKGTRRILLILFAIGAGLLIHAGAGFEVWLGSILKNGNLLAMLILVPLISAPFYYEDYQTELANLAKIRMHSVLSFLLLTAVCTHMLSAIVSVGSLLVFYGLLAPYASLYRAEKPFLSTLARAHNASGFWSPAWASIIVYSAVPGMQWARVIPAAIGMVILYLIIHFAGLFVEMRRYPDRYPRIHGEPGTVVNRKRLMTMLVLVVCMILSIIALNLAAGLDLMIAVCITALLFPPAVALLQKKCPEYRAGMVTYREKQLPKVQGQVALFMISGFFGNALSVSGAGEQLAGLLPGWLTAYPPLMVAALMLMLILPSTVGIHPLAPGTALLSALTPAAVGLSPYTFGLSIIVGWLLAILVGPFSAAALLLSSLTGKSNYHTSIGINWGFTLVCLLVFSLLIPLIGPMLG